MKAMIAVAVIAVGLVLALLAVVVGRRVLEQHVEPSAETPSPIPPASPPATVEATRPATEAEQGFLYGRVTTTDGIAYEGRLRWGRDQEAFWGDSFNGVKHENPWIVHVPPEQAPEERRSFEIFGFELGGGKRELDVRRPLMTRFGEITRIEAHADKVRVTLKSGTAFEVNRFDASDFDDGLRVWDAAHGVVDLDSLRIRTVELLPTPSFADAPRRLHGTVRARPGEFTGFIGWDRHEYVGTDTLDGQTAEGEDLGLRFDTIRSIARRSRDSSLVTLLDGREVVLADTHEVGEGNRGIYVEDRRYGRVLVSWGVFERVDFDADGSSGPAYDDFPPGRPLTGVVTARDGRRLAGRIVYDLDESETIETLDAPSQGVDYTIPFGLIASIVPRGRDERDARLATVSLHDGALLQLERSGDLGEAHAGMLIFVDGGQRPEYVRWSEVERVELDRPR